MWRPLVFLVGGPVVLFLGLVAPSTGKGDDAKADTAVYMGFEPIYEGGRLKVTKVGNGSPAATAGLKANDVILELEGKKIADEKDYWNQLRTKKPGDQVAVKVQRGVQTLTLRVTLGKRPG